MEWKQEKIQGSHKNTMEISTQKMTAHMIARSHHQNHLLLPRESIIIIGYRKKTMSWLWLVARAASCISWSQNRWKFAPSVMANFFTLTDLKMGRLESDFLFDSFSLFLCFFLFRSGNSFVCFWWKFNAERSWNAWQMSCYFVSLLLVFYQIFVCFFFLYSYVVPLLYYGSHWHCRRVLRASGKVNILERTVSFLSMIATCSSPSLSSLL